MFSGPKRSKAIPKLDSLCRRHRHLSNHLLRRSLLQEYHAMSSNKLGHKGLRPVIALTTIDRGKTARDSLLNQTKRATHRQMKISPISRTRAEIQDSPRATSSTNTTLPTLMCSKTRQAQWWSVEGHSQSAPPTSRRFHSLIRTMWHKHNRR